MPPGDLLQKALDHGVRVLSITDHETTDGLAEALENPLAARLDLLPGIELSAEGDFTCHILGYALRWQDASFQAWLSSGRERRLARARAMVAKLQGMGISIAFDLVVRHAGKAAVGRPHIADALVELRVVRSRQEAFQRFLGYDGPAYIEGGAPTARETIERIRQAGGVAVLAHPSFYSDESRIETLVGHGLQGVEVFYPDVSRSLREKFLGWCQRWSLIATGGSDFHGPRTGRSELACVDVPAEAVEAIRSAARP